MRSIFGRSAVLCLFFLAGTWIAACDKDGITDTDMPNRAPVAAGSIPAQTLGAEETVTLDLSPWFNDPDGDMLAYSARSSDASVATASVSGNTLAIRAVPKTEKFSGRNIGEHVGENIPAGVPDALNGSEVWDGSANASSGGLNAEKEAEIRSMEAAYRNQAASSEVAEGAVLIASATQETVTITVTASDPDGLSATQAFDATVDAAAANRAPQADGTIPAQTVEAGAKVEVNAAPWFSDPDGDPLSYQAASSNPAIAGVSVAGNIVTVQGVAQGAAKIEITASDADGLSATQDFDVTVTAVAAGNRAPQADGTIPAQTVEAGAKVEVNAAPWFSDPDGDPLSYQAASSNPAIAGVSVAGNIVTVQGVAQGAAKIEITASDAGGLSATQAFDVTVTTAGVANRAPQADGTIPAQTVEAGAKVEVNAAPWFSDPDGDPLSYQAASAHPAVATVSVAGSIVTVQGVAQGAAKIEIAASDADGLSATQAFDVTVTANTGPEPPPVVVRYKRVAMFVVDFPDNEETFPTPKEIEKSLEEGIVKEFFNVISHNHFTYDIDSFGPFTHQDSSIALFPDHLFSALSINSLNIDNFNTANYDVFLVITLTDYEFEGAWTNAATYGGLKVNGQPLSSDKSLVVHSLFKGCRKRNCDAGPYEDVFTELDLNGGPSPFTPFQRIFAHEFLHALGIWTHAYSRTNGPRFDYEPEISDNHGNLKLDYGNYYDIMGAPEYGYNLNVGFRDLLGWLALSRKMIIKTPGCHTATIDPINSMGQITAVEIRIPDSRTQYYLEVRDFMDKWDTRGHFPFSQDIMRANRQGVMVNKTLDGITTYLLDMSPTKNIAQDGLYFGAGQPDIRDVVLKTGLVYDAPDIKLYNVKAGPRPNSWTVDILLKPSDGRTISCGDM